MIVRIGRNSKTHGDLFRHVFEPFLINAEVACAGLAANDRTMKAIAYMFAPLSTINSQIAALAAAKSMLCCLRGELGGICIFNADLKRVRVRRRYKTVIL